MVKHYRHDSATPLLPLHGNLEDLKKAAKNCKACDLWKHGTQTVFGEGAPNAKIMFVGEQPGDQEDLEGRPFVGPAGKLLDAALAGNCRVQAMAGRRDRSASSEDYCLTGSDSGAKPAGPGFSRHPASGRAPFDAQRLMARVDEILKATTHTTTTKTVGEMNLNGLSQLRVHDCTR